MYYLYELSFHGSDDIYIGCSTDIGKRFAQHKASEQWLDFCVIPKCIRIVKTTEILEEAQDFEIYLITLTWDYNFNKTLWDTMAETVQLGQSKTWQEIGY